MLNLGKSPRQNREGRILGVGGSDSGGREGRILGNVEGRKLGDTQGRILGVGGSDSGGPSCLKQVIFNRASIFNKKGLKHLVSNTASECE